MAVLGLAFGVFFLFAAAPSIKEIISNHYFFVIDDNKQCPDCEARHEKGLGP